MAQKITCPFCFTDFTLQDIRFRCMFPTCPGRAPDPVYANARGLPTTLMGCILIPRKGKFGNGPVQGVQCGACKQMSHTRICPHCHFELAPDIGQVDSRIIAIIGGSATGKTHYIASLVKLLQGEVGQNFNIAVRMMGEDTQRRWINDFYTPLFVRKRELAGTQSGFIDSIVKSPLLFRFMFNDGKRLRALNVSFFDSAGEDMTSLASMVVQNRYICHADAIVFLLDPLQIQTVRLQLPPLPAQKRALPEPNPAASPEYIVGNLRDLFEREHGLRAVQRVNVPIAFTLSKIDMLSPILDPGSALLRPGNHPGYVDLNDIQGINTEVSSYLSEWINPSFLSTVRNGFSSYNFFGVSALGEPPDAKGNLSTVSPLRVEDPFLWLLYKLDLIKGKKGW
jgi:hypothetical protein